MRVLMKGLAPLIFWFAYGLFRMGPGKKSLRKHQFVMRVFRFAADNGSRRALSVYGHLLHFRGDGVQNRIQGAIYLERAAQAGDMKACYQMGKVYEAGFEHYFKPDVQKALSFFERAAQLGHPLAIRRMAEVFEHGELEQQVDAELAAKWRQRQSV